MAKYRQENKGQLRWLTVDLEAQILPNTFEWALKEIVNKKLDFGAFDETYANDIQGRPAVDPRTLLKLILYGYSKSVIGSRRLEQLSQNNLVAAALCGGEKIGHATISDFVSANADKLKELFTDVLLYCNEAGLIGGAMFAIDGYRLSSNASKEWSGTLDKLKAKKEKFEAHSARLLSAHRGRDAQADEGDNHAAEIDLKKAAENLAKKAKYIDNFLKAREDLPNGGRKMGTRGKEIKSNITDNESATIKGPHGVVQGYNGIATADSKAGIIVAAEVFGADYEGAVFPEMLDNIDSALHLMGLDGEQEKPLLLGDTNYFSESNLTAALEHGIETIIPDPHFRQRDEKFAERQARRALDRDRQSAKNGEIKKSFTLDDFTYDESENTYICPCGIKLICRGEAEKSHERIFTRYSTKQGACAGCPYMKQCMSTRGGKKPRKTLYVPKGSQNASLCEQMRQRIDSPEGKALYAHRMGIIEPCFANIGYCKGMNRLTVRTKRKANAQWLLYCMVHNIGKCTEVAARIAI